jgi:hypothetical protein
MGILTSCTNLRGLFHFDIEQKRDFLFAYEQVMIQKKALYSEQSLIFSLVYFLAQVIFLNQN